MEHNDGFIDIVRLKAEIIKKDITERNMLPTMLRMHKKLVDHFVIKYGLSDYAPSVKEILASGHLLFENHLDQITWHLAIVSFTQMGFGVPESETLYRFEELGDFFVKTGLPHLWESSKWYNRWIACLNLE